MRALERIDGADGGHLRGWLFTVAYHQAMLTRLCEAAEDLRLPPAVLTFDPHPREFFAKSAAPPRLSKLRQKLELFQTLVKCGFKEIEVGFPSASNTEFSFNRRLIEETRAPGDVWLQALVQAREDLIERTFESLVGAKKAIIHIYNSTSPAQRRVVFGMSKEEIVRVASKIIHNLKTR